MKTIFLPITIPKKIYQLCIEQTVEYEYDSQRFEYALTRDEAIKLKEKIIFDNRRNGNWIPNITSLTIDINECDTKDILDEITIEQFEQLFDIKFNIGD